MSLLEPKTQPQVSRLLKGAIKKGRLAHGLLFKGPAGSDQREMALWLGATLLCENPKDENTCGECAQCRLVFQKSHPDLIVIEPEEDAAGIKVDAIRELIGKTNLKPFQASSKVFVIDQAHTMNDIAQNALLKTLEEPQGRTFIILIASDPEALLVTLRSRLQSFSFLPVASLEKESSELLRLKEAALSYVSQGRGEPPDLSKLDRQETVVIIDGLIAYFRELLILRAGASEILDGNQSWSSKEIQAKTYGSLELGKTIEFISEIKEKISHNMNTKLTLSILWDGLEKTNAR